MTDRPEVIDRPETPELDRRHEIIESGRAQVAEEFYDWLTEQGFILAKYVYKETVPCPGVKRDPFDNANCDNGVVMKTVTQWIGSKRAGKVEAGETCPKCQGSGEIEDVYQNPPLMPYWTTGEQILADFFGIDRDKIEQEQRALLEHIRSNA